jgi:hypothetical protein
VQWAAQAPAHVYGRSLHAQALDSDGQGFAERAEDVVEPRALVNDSEEAVGVELMPHRRQFVVDMAQEGSDPVQRREGRQCSPGGA